MRIMAIADFYFDLKDESTPEFLEMIDNVSQDFSVSQGDAANLMRGLMAVGNLLKELPQHEKQNLLITLKQTLQQNPSIPMLTHVSAFQDLVRQIHQQVVRNDESC